MSTVSESTEAAIDLNVRGEIPAGLDGYLLVACSRRNKDRAVFSRWHDSQADLLRIDLRPGRPGRVRASIFAVDPSGRDVEGAFPRTDFDRRAWGTDPAYGYLTQPNHAINVSGRTGWATNLLFGAPLEFDVESMRATRVLRYLAPSNDAPRVSGSSHFAWSLDHRYAYFHQSLLARDCADHPARTRELTLVRLEVRTNTARLWKILAPPGNAEPEADNFHSAFYFEQNGKPCVGLLRTGAVVESLAPHATTVPEDHQVIPSPPSEIWVVELDELSKTLQARLLPGIRELGMIALSHLDVDNTARDGFVLYANAKQADVAEETHGRNVYGEPQTENSELYPGMSVEAFAPGFVIRVEWRDGSSAIKVFRRPYDPGMTSLGHTWLPINVSLDSSRKSLFCTFAGLRPRLMSKHVVAAYGDSVVDPTTVRYIPPLLMRFDAETLEPDADDERRYLSYAEPMAMTVIGETSSGFVCTFSPEIGLRIYRANDLGSIVGHALSGELMNYADTHFRPEPAHMVYVPR